MASEPIKEAAKDPEYLRIAENVKEQIMSGELLPGDRLPTEAEFTEQYKVSRSTVREALRMLATQNLTFTTRGVLGGTFVAYPTPAQVADSLELGFRLLVANPDGLTARSLHEVREIVEVPAVILAAERITPEQLARLDEFMKGNEVQTWDRRGAIRSFHELLIEAVNNNLLEMVTEPIFAAINHRFSFHQQDPEFKAQADRDHEEIYLAVKAGDSSAAAQAMRDHLRNLESAYFSQQ